MKAQHGRLPRELGSRPLEGVDIAKGPRCISCTWRGLDPLLANTTSLASGLSKHENQGRADTIISDIFGDCLFESPTPGSGFGLYMLGGAPFPRRSRDVMKINTRLFTQFTNLPSATPQTTISNLTVAMSCEACRTIPPVTAKGYTPQGQFEKIAGLNTCTLTIPPHYGSP